MSFQWLQLRISEENHRRKREADILERMPRALDEVHQAMADCVANYQSVYGAESANLKLDGGNIHVTIHERKGQWQQVGSVTVEMDAELPGFHIARDGQKLAIEVGLLPGDRLCYRDREKDQYLSMEEVTRRILDRALFPKLKD